MNALNAVVNKQRVIVNEQHGNGATAGVVDRACSIAAAKA